MNAPEFALACFVALILLGLLGCAVKLVARLNDIVNELAETNKLRQRDHDAAHEAARNDVILNAKLADVQTRRFAPPMHNAARAAVASMDVSPRLSGRRAARS